MRVPSVALTYHPTRRRGLRGAGRRMLQWLRQRVRAPSACVVHHPDYAIPVRGVPLDPQRADRILAYLLDAGLIRPRDVFRPLPASLENVARVHTPSYLESLDTPDTLERIFGFPVSDEQRQRIVDYQRLLSGGTILATRLALRTGRVAVNLGGGFHHAHPDRGMGFSLINDMAVAVARLRARGFGEPVLIVDLDLHDGNGTRRAFASDPTVHTFSIHNDTWDEGAAVADTCRALGPDVDDARYLDTLRATLPPVIREHRPGLVIYLAGTDPAADDALGNWRITEHGLLERDRFVVSEVRAGERRPALAVALAGGYGPRAWRYSARFLGWLLAGRVLDPTEDVDAVVRRYRRVLLHAGAALQPAPGGGPDWTLTEEDLGVGAPTRELRVLGALSKHAIELTLERLGILHQIRSMGFAAPAVAVDAASPLGQTIRLYGDPGGRELLLELRLGVKRDTVPGADTLYVEWLLLQNPRARFTEERRPLPGQEHPGLGLLREVVGWLVVTAESLRFDGIAFCAAHYYMAALGRRHLEFVRPQDAAAFEAVRAALGGLDVADATRAVDEGRVADARTGEPFRWPAPLMVVPLTDKLRARVSGPQYDEAVRRARERLAYRLVSRER